MSSFALSASCSTMYNSGNQSMQIAASDGGSHRVSISTPHGSYTTTLPTTVTAAPSTFSGVRVNILESKELNPTSVEVRKNLAPSYFVNILNGIGFIIDPLVGTMWNYDAMTTVTVSKKKFS